MSLRSTCQRLCSWHPLKGLQKAVDAETDRSPGSERRQSRYVTLEQYRRDRRRSRLAYAVLLLASVLSAYLGYHANNRTTEEQNHNAIVQAGNAKDAVLRSCLSRQDLRVTTAAGLDALRSAALVPPRHPTPEQKAAIKGFIHRTQVPINDLLSQAAGVRIRVKPEGILPKDTLQLVQDDIKVRCAQEASVFTRTGRDLSSRG